jgi:glucose/arabinose dehydrogenase
MPSIGVTGMTFYTGDRFPSWKRNVFVGGLREGEIPRTEQLQRIVFNEKWQEIRRESLLRELHQRIRDVRQGPTMERCFESSRPPTDAPLSPALAARNERCLCRRT